MSIVEKLQARGDAWDPYVEASEAELVRAEEALGRKLDRDHRALLAAGGREIMGAGHLLLFKARDLPRFNGDGDSAWQPLTEMLVFGDDSGDFVYFYDPDDRLGRGAWALFAIAKSAASIERAWYVARDLGELVDRVLDDDTLLDDRSR